MLLTWIEFVFLFCGLIMLVIDARGRRSRTKFHIWNLFRFIPSPRGMHEQGKTRMTSTPVASSTNLEMFKVWVRDRGYGDGHVRPASTCHPHTSTVTQLDTLSLCRTFILFGLNGFGTPLPLEVSGLVSNYPPVCSVLMRYLQAVTLKAATPLKSQDLNPKSFLNVKQ